MEKLFEINGKTILDVDTTILHTSKYNYNSDIIELIHNDCEVITKDNNNNINDIPLRLLAELDLLELINKKDLTKMDEILISVLTSLTSTKSIIVFYDVLTYIDSEIKALIIKMLKDAGKRIINYTSEIEETLLLDYIIIVHKNEVVMEGKKEVVLLEEKIIKKLGFNMPCVVELSSGLKYYGILDKVYYDKKLLVDVLWK